MSKTFLPILTGACLLRAGLLAEPVPLLTFGVMGDVPYESYEDELLPLQIAGIPAELPFVVHVGDIKRGGVPCDTPVYEKVAGMLSQSKPPVFIIPGDNESNDCADPISAWKRWQAYFDRFDEKWKHAIPVNRQEGRSENFAFVMNRVLFVGIHLVGGRVQDPAEWRARHADDIRWVTAQFSGHGVEVEAAVLFSHATPTPKHADFFPLLEAAAKEFGKPVAYIQGDGHKFIYDHPFLTATNMHRIQVDRGGIAPPIRVSVFAGADEPFVIDRRLDAQPAGFPRSEEEAKAFVKKGGAK